MVEIGDWFEPGSLAHRSCRTLAERGRKRQRRPSSRTVAWSRATVVRRIQLSTPSALAILAGKQTTTRAVEGTSGGAMDDLKFTSRWVAILLLAQLVIGPIANFTLLGPVFSGDGGFLVNAAPHATRTALAALLSIGLAVVTAVIGIVMWPILRQRSERMAVALVALGTACVALSGFENAGVMSMVSLSKVYVAAAAPDEALFQGLRAVVAGQRNWGHFTQLLSAGATLLTFYAALYRFNLVPKLLAGLGVLAALSQMIAVSNPFFGNPVMFPMLAPLAVAHVALAVTLLWKGMRAV